MNIVVAFKVVPDDQDIQVAADRTLDYSKAKPVVSTYDLNAIEAAAQLAAACEGSSLKAMTIGGSFINDSKLKKNVLARGVDELFMVTDGACEGMDAFATGNALAALVGKMGEFDLIVCGDGSADNYAQQVDVQLAAALGIPVVNGAVKIEALDGAVRVTRVLESTEEVVEVALPAVVSVVPDAAMPRIPGMKDILAAGKKPMNDVSNETQITNVIEVVKCEAPEQADRKLQIFEASDDGSIQKFAEVLKAAL